jgi:hypothetical protein
MSNLKIYKVKDKAESFYTKKPVIFDLPMRLLIVGKSQLSGKSNLLVNLLLRDEYYGSDFKGDDIYLVSPSATTDDKLIKLIKAKNIPETNIMDNYDEEVITELYNMLEEEYKEDVNNSKRPTNKLIIFDDCSYGGDLKKKKTGIISRLFSNGRHINVSTLVTAQQYVQLPTSAREQANGAIFFSCSNSQLELIEKEHNYNTNKRDFMKLFRDTMTDKHSFFVVNYTNPKEERYMDEEFRVIHM